MKYDITSNTPPPMPRLGKGTECLKLILSQASKDMQAPLLPMLFPILGVHVSGTEFQYPDRTWREPCGMMAHLVARSGAGKGQLSSIAEALCRNLRSHDEGELARLVEWQRTVRTRGANKEKPPRPEVAFWFLPSDVTNPAFIQNSMACESQGGRTQYINMPEVEMADRLCGGHRQVSQMLRNIYDRQRAGALRATAEGVTGNPLLRANITISSTPLAARKFYKGDFHTGTFGRMVFSCKPRTARTGRIPRQGTYSEEFHAELAKYLLRLQEARGRHVITPLNLLADRLARDMADISDLADDDDLFDMAKRAILSAWKAGCIMWILAGGEWTRAMADIVEWLVCHDLWSKMQLFADLIATESSATTPAACHRGPKNMLDSLPDAFSLPQLEALRINAGKSKEGTKFQLKSWKTRGFITLSPQTGLYTKTPAYLGGKGTTAAKTPKD